MPVAVARKIEWLLRDEGLDLDIQVRPILLTHDQCIQYALPRTLIKEGERRSARFEERFGEGATELDALTALHPGIVQREIERYYDYGLAGRWNLAKADIEGELERISDEVQGAYATELANIAAAYRDLNSRTARLHAQMAEDLEDRADDVEIPEIDRDEADEDPDPLRRVQCRFAKADDGGARCRDGAAIGKLPPEVRRGAGAPGAADWLAYNPFSIEFGAGGIGVTALARVHGP